MGYNTCYQKLTCWPVLLFLLMFMQGYAQNPYTYASTKSKANGPARSFSTYQSSSQEKQTLLAVLKELNRVKGVYFLFSEESMGTVMVKAAKDYEGDTEKILKEILKDTGLKYKKISTKLSIN